MEVVVTNVGSVVMVEGTNCDVVVGGPPCSRSHKRVIHHVPLLWRKARHTPKRNRPNIRTDVHSVA